MSTSPPAAAPDRPRRRGAWRDPRIAVGVVLIAGSVVLGALVLADDDPGAPVWQATEPLAPGAVIEAGALETVRVPLPERARAAYVSAAAPLPEGTVARRGVAAGELLPAAALADDGPVLEQVPISTADDGVPGTIRPGSVVDVWVTPGEGLDDLDAVRVLDDVTVVSLPAGVSLGGGSPRPLVVGVAEGSVSDLGSVLARLADGAAVVVGQG